MTLAKLAFGLAALVLIWPIHYQATTGGSTNGRTDKFTLSNFETRTCPWELHSRASQSVLWLIVGAALMGSAYRRRMRPARLPDLVPLPN